MNNPISRSLVIRVPCLPDRRLSPNASRKLHWGAKTKAKRELQEATFGACLAATQEYRKRASRVWNPLKHAIIHIRIVVSDRRRIMDSDNTIASLKPALDCLQAYTGKWQELRAGIIVNDRDLRIGNVEWEVSRSKPRGMIFTIEEELSTEE